MANEISAIEKPPAPATTVKRGSNHPVHQTLSGVANLANLLPTGTVLAFQTLIPSFSHNGFCQQISNKYLTSCVIITCALICFLSSFTDSFIDNNNGGKLYYGTATFKGMYVFNYNDMEDEEEDMIHMNKHLEKYRIKFIDFVHAMMSLVVFLVFAVSNSNVQSCFLSGGGINISDLAMNLPLGIGIFSTFLFTIFPTTRRGIGYADIVSEKSTIDDSRVQMVNEM